jgi:hypothetical protein
MLKKIKNKIDETLDFILEALFTTTVHKNEKKVIYLLSLITALLVFFVIFF